MTPPGLAATGRPRFAAIDAIKALAIVAVVFQHSGVFYLHPRFDEWDRALRTTWNQFHVPAFLLVAGFLYAKVDPIGLADLRRRLTRVLVPYLLVSPLALWCTPLPARFTLPFALATGATNGVYYFIFVLVECIALSWLLSRLPHWTHWVLVAISTLYIFALYSLPELRLSTNRFWLAREPLINYYFGYFTIGWIAARNTARLAGWAERHGVAIAGIAILAMLPAIAHWFGFDPPLTNNALRVPYSLGVVTLVALAARGKELPAWIVRLSDQTLAIYLLHILVLQQAQDHFAPVRIVMLAAFALAITSAFANGARRLLGAKLSRSLLGA